MTKLIPVGTLICLIGLILSSGCGPQAPSSIGGTLRIGEGYQSVSLGYPPKLVKAWSNRQVAPSVETLLRYDETGKLIPWLATGYKDDVTNKAIILSLRKDVKFHDGTIFNAEAVKWNLDQSKSAKTTGTSMFKSIDVVDDYTVRISLNSWDSTVLSNLASTLGLMISPTAFKKNGEDWCAKNPVGTGPFEFVSMQTDVGVKYKRFDDYWQKGKPYLDKVEFTIVVDALTRQMSFKANEFDVVTQISQQDYASLRKSGYNVTSHSSGSGAWALIPDSADPKSPFSNLKVRQAATYAIDTNAINKTAFAGENEATNQWVFKGHWAYNSNVAGYPYNPTKAKQLLAEAGYPNGFKTKLNYVTSATNDMAMSIVQSQLKAIGIDTQMSLLQTAAWTTITSTGSWEGLMHSSGSGDPEIISLMAQRYSGANWHKPMQVPEEYLKAIQNAITAPDFATKQKYAQEIQKLMIDKYCMLIPLYCNTDCAVGQTYVRNLNLCKTPFTVQWTPEDCFMDKK